MCLLVNGLKKECFLKLLFKRCMLVDWCLPVLDYKTFDGISLSLRYKMIGLGYVSNFIVFCSNCHLLFAWFPLVKQITFCSHFPYGSNFLND